MWFAAVDPPPLSLPYYLTRVSAGFPSPAEDYLDESLDLNAHLVKRPATTFFCRASGDSMVGVGIRDGDLLVVDRSVPLRDGLIVVAAVGSDHVVKRFVRRPDGVYLVSANDRYPPIHVTDVDSRVFGVVTFVVHQLGSPPAGAGCRPCSP